MAVPKWKQSKARTKTRQNNNSKLSVPTLTECQNCHEKIFPHTVCNRCGYYKGIKRIETRTDKKAKKQEAK
ncbi:MAG: 50S ribosomal protein L32 [Christensenellaceae bacterium]|jgi:large subunit ribosomal protein L32|nr:50S ribosomal protein L32 [Christensenellaceae bacterium]